MGNYAGRYPAIVRSYDGASRTCRVEIPGVTEGGDVLPLAEIEYPIGDRSKGTNPTEIEFLKGDTVWIAFIGGDERYPIITGYRNPSSGNSVAWRRFHHANFELTADGTFRINADKFELNAKTSVVITTPDATIDGEKTTITGEGIVEGGFVYKQGMTGTGGGEVAGDLTVDGVSATGHTHKNVKSGSDNSGAPNK